jgi:hypothetical protein
VYSSFSRSAVSNRAVGVDIEGSSDMPVPGRACWLWRGSLGAVKMVGKALKFRDWSVAGWKWHANPNGFAYGWPMCWCCGVVRCLVVTMMRSGCGWNGWAVAAATVG